MMTSQRNLQLPSTASAAASRGYDSMSGVKGADERMEQSLRKLSKEMDIKFNENPFRRFDKKIIVAAGARTGSHLLCEKLEFHGVDVRESFSTNRILNKSAKKNIRSLPGYCEYLFKQSASNGAFGVKGGVSILSIPFWCGEMPEFAREWGWIYLKREDVVKQAISHFLAQRSGAFRSRSADRARVVAEGEYDAIAIRDFVISHSRANQMWEDLFAALSLEPCRITYEQLAADPVGVAADVAARVGLDGPPIADMKPPEIALQKQASTLNKVWEARFLEEQPEFRTATPGDGQI